MLTKKIWANFQRILELFTQKIVPDPGSGSATRGTRVPDICNNLIQVWVRFTVLGFEIDIFNSLTQVALRYGSRPGIEFCNSLTQVCGCVSRY